VDNQRDGSIKGRRLGGLAGILFIVCVLAAPDPSLREGASPDQIRQFYLDNQQALGLMLTLVGIGYVLFLIFSTALQSTARDPESRSDWAATLMLVSAALIAGFYVLGAALRLTPAAGVAAGASAALLEPMARVAETANNGFIEMATYWRGAMLASAAFIILRTRLVPKWIGWMAAVLAVTSFAGGFSFVESPLQSPLGGVGFASFALFHLWILIASVALAFGGRRVSASVNALDVEPAI
jgi:hypothetical protein